MQNTVPPLPALEQPYLDLLEQVRSQGAEKGDRTGTGTRSIFGAQMRFDLSRGFPLLTTKKVHWKSIAYELLWFLRGDGNAKWLQDRGVTIWNEWAKPDGDLGPVYGVQWRSWPKRDSDAKDGCGTIDQIAQAVEMIKRDPNSRRIIVSAWNVADLPKMALLPCHAFFQFYVADPISVRDRARAKEEGLDDTLPKPRLSCQLYQRSADLFLGVPFNIASYALLTHMIAQQCDLDVGDFIWTGGDCHIYNNHFEQLELQLSRKPKPLPKMILNPEIKNIFDFDFEDFTLEGYEPHALIKGSVAV